MQNKPLPKLKPPLIILVAAVLGVVLASYGALRLSHSRSKLADAAAPADDSALKADIGKKADSHLACSDTASDREMANILGKGGRDIDLALANWLIASEIPEFRDMTRGSYFAQLDDMTEQVRAGMEKMQDDGYGGTDPNDPKTKCRRFCSAIIGLHFDYAEEFRQEDISPAQSKALYENPGNIFLAGLMRTRQGSCVSMPLIYLVIGQRLGLPIHLVAIGKHFFIRWDEPGFRVDIETTSTRKIAWTADDSVCLDIEGMKRDQLRGSDLRNLSNREVVGELFFIRMSYWHARGPDYETQSLNDLALAHQLASEDPAIEKTYAAVFSRGPAGMPQHVSEQSQINKKGRD
jgi:Transglutaminase-like superfamily